MRIDIERTYRVKLFEGGGELELNDYAPNEIELSSNLFLDIDKLNDKGENYSIDFLFDKGVLREVKIKTKYIDVREKDIDEVKDVDEKTIISRIKKNFRDAALKDCLILVYLKTDKKEKRVTKLRDKTGLWKWRTDVYASNVYGDGLKDQDHKVYKALKEILFGVGNSTKAKF